MQCNWVMSRDHRKLDVFHLADDLVLKVYRATLKFPPGERYGLQSQVRRAAVSIPTNIVEGCARAGEGDYLRFLDIAFGSARELLYLIDLSMRLGFLEPKDANELINLGDRTAGKLSNLRDSVGK